VSEDLLGAPIFEVTVSAAGSATSVVTAAGELDILTAPQLLRCVAALAPPVTSCVAIDLSAVTFIDSSGINALRTAVRSAHARGVAAVVAAPGEHVQKVLDLVRIGDVLALEPTLASALERLRAESAPPA
jgi:anti-anti-sigma factor